MIEALAWAFWGRRMLKGLQYVPRVIVTDETRRCGAARRELLHDIERRQSQYLNNRAETWHSPTRPRERRMRWCKSSERAKAFPSAHAFSHGHVQPGRHPLAADTNRAIRTEAFNVRRQDTSVRNAA
jgi:putative transposase